MSLALALSMFSFAGLAVGVMELDNWRKRRADRDAFSLVDAREAAQTALREARRTW